MDLQGEEESIRRRRRKRKFYVPFATKMELQPQILRLLLITLVSILLMAIKTNSSDSPVNEAQITTTQSLQTPLSSGDSNRSRKIPALQTGKRSINQEDKEEISTTGRPFFHSTDDQLDIAKMQAVLMLNGHNKNTPPLFITKTRDFFVDLTRHPLGSKITTMQAVDIEGDRLSYSLQPASFHDASPYFSIDHEKGDLFLDHKQFPLHSPEQPGQVNSRHGTDEDDDKDEDEDEDESGQTGQPSVNRNLYFLNVVADDGLYSSIVELQIHVTNSSGPIQVARSNQQVTKAASKPARTTPGIHSDSAAKRNHQEFGRTIGNNRRHKNNTIVHLQPELSSTKAAHEFPTTATATTIAPSGELIVEATHPSSPLNQVQPSLAMQNEGQKSEQVVGPSLIAQPVIITLVVACSCLMIALVLLIFIVPLSMKLKRRLRHVERQHEHLSQQNSNGSSIGCSSSGGSMATHSHMPSLSQFTLGSDRSCRLSGASVLRQSSIDSSATIKSPQLQPPPLPLPGQVNANGPLNRINNGSIVNPLYLEQQQPAMVNPHVNLTRQNAYLMDEAIRGGVSSIEFNRNGDNVAINNDYYPLDDDFYSTINTDSSVLNDASQYQRKLFCAPIICENALDRINEDQLMTDEAGLKSPSPDSGSSIRSLVKFLSLPDRRHGNQVQNQTANTRASNDLFADPPSLVDANCPTSSYKQHVQCKTIARASDVAREQQVDCNNNNNSSSSSSNQWELERHKLKFVAILDEGQFGLVWRCELKLSNSQRQTVAVKTLKNNALLDERGRDELLAEIRIMKMVCRHPNVVKILHCCTSDVSSLQAKHLSTVSATAGGSGCGGKPILLVMEYVELGKLQSFLEKSRVNHRYATNLYTNTHATSDHLTSRDLIKFIYHVAKGMEYISGQCIVHRDLASRNILVSSERICKIGDFGMARHMQSSADIYERHSRNSKVPVRWMAPEVLKDNKFTIKSDVFSFGILMWEIVTLGSTPYRYLETDKIPKEVAYRGRRPEKPDYCHPQLYQIMSTCWSHEPDERPTFNCLVQQLDQILMSSEDYIELDQYPDNNYYNILKTEAPNELL